MEEVEGVGTGEVEGVVGTGEAEAVVGTGEAEGAEAGLLEVVGTGDTEEVDTAVMVDTDIAGGVRCLWEEAVTVVGGPVGGLITIHMPTFPSVRAVMIVLGESV